MAATTDHSINTGPYEENTEIYSSLKLLYWRNLNCASIIGRSFTNFVFFMLIVIPRWTFMYSLAFNNICSFWEEGIWTFSHRVQC
jgi:hypothetical protein